MSRSPPTIEQRIQLSAEQVDRLRHLTEATQRTKAQAVAKALDILISLTDILDARTEPRGWSFLPEEALRACGTTTTMPGTITGGSSMAFQRGDVALVPFSFSDLSTIKVTPTAVASSALYHATEPDLILAGITSRVAAAAGPLDYILSDWRATGRRFPAAFRPVPARLEPGQVLHRAGALTARDLTQVARRVRRILDL